MHPYKLAIFDLDGTLADSFPWFLSVLDSVADKYGFKRPVDVDALRGMTSREIIRTMDVPAWRLPSIARHVRMLKSKADIPLFPDIPEILSELGQSLTLAVVSSDSEANVRRTLGASAKDIRWYDCGASLFGKASHFKRVLRRAGVEPHEAIAIGDEVRDGEAAHKIGIAFGAVAWGYAKPEALEDLSQVVFRKPSDLLNLKSDL